MRFTRQHTVYVIRIQAVPIDSDDESPNEAEVEAWLLPITVDITREVVGDDEPESSR